MHVQNHIQQHQNMQQGANKPLAVAVPYRSNDPEAKEHHDDITNDPGYRAESQCLGYSLMVLFASFYILLTLRCARSYVFRRYTLASLLGVFGFGLGSCFWIIALHDPKFLGGKPASYKFLPLLLSDILACASISTVIRRNLIGMVLGCIVIALIQYFVLFQDDTTESRWLMFKPWVYEKLWSVVFIGNLPSSGQVSDQTQPSYTQPAPYQSAPYQAAPAPYMGQSYPTPSYPANSYPPPPQYSQAQAQTQYPQSYLNKH